MREAVDPYFFRPACMVLLQDTAQQRNSPEYESAQGKCYDHAGACDKQEFDQRVQWHAVEEAGGKDDDRRIELTNAKCALRQKARQVAL